MNATNATNTLTTMNSILMVRLVTGKPKLSATLETTHKKIAYANGADEKFVRAPSAKLFVTKGNAIGEVNNLINGMSIFLKKKGMSVPDFDGTTYQQATDADEIQAEFDTRRDAIDGLLAEIRRDYDSYVSEALKHINGFRSEVEWPTVDEFIGGYKFDLKWLGQPQSIKGTVLAKVSSETAARVRASSEQSVNQMLLEAHGGCISAAIAEMGEAITALTKGQRLRQERFDRLESCAEELRNKNWLNLPELDAVIDLLKPCIIQADTLPEPYQRREHAKRITEAKAAAEKTLTDLGL